MRTECLNIFTRQMEKKSFRTTAETQCFSRPGLVVRTPGFPPGGADSNSATGIHPNKYNSDNNAYRRLSPVVRIPGFHPARRKRTSCSRHNFQQTKHSVSSGVAQRLECLVHAQEVGGLNPPIGRKTVGIYYFNRCGVAGFSIGGSHPLDPGSSPGTGISQFFTRNSHRCG